MKIDLFYLKSERSLYAYTAYKEYADAFYTQRNPNLFIHKRKKMDDDTFSFFMSENRILMLCKIPLTDGANDYTIIATSKEDSILSDACTTLDNELDALYFSLTSLPFKEKYLELIEHLTSKVTKRNVGMEIELDLNVDTFALFMYLFKNTFASVPEDFDNLKFINERK